ncbi:MAG: stage III sporulation protein AB [Defluviitaleaceae bacterium]|nr:stage III sporulation protein AB [Defluviitaleaceae bacterium]
MLIQALGAVLIIGSSTMWGAYMAAKSYFRLRDLREMKRAFGILISEIDYAQSPLEEAAVNIAIKCSLPIKGIFENFSKGLSGKVNVWELWSETIENSQKDSYFSTEDMEVFKSFGKTLGYLDREMQLRNIEMQIDYINQKTDELEKTWEKSRKMYLSLGALGGVMAVILLI